MIGDILNALMLECQAYLEANYEPDGTKGQVVFDTDFGGFQGEVTYGMPLIVINVPDAPDSMMYLGGNTRMDYAITFDCFNFEPDAMGDDPTGYSTSLTNFVDGIREHFSYAGTTAWLTTEMNGLENEYGFRMTFTGLHAGTTAGKNGLIKGFKVAFESVALDQVTAFFAESDVPLTTVVQEDSVTGQPISSDMKQGYNILPYSNITGMLEVDLPAGTYLDSIYSEASSGSPAFFIGTTPGGSDVLSSITPGTFKKSTMETNYPAAISLYVTITGGNINISFVLAYNLFS